MRGVVLALFALALACAGVSAERQSIEPGLPSVVLIITDDVGYGDFGSYGAPDVKTPHIDRLAKEGVRLTDFYANAPVCTPTRAGLITGRYQQRVALERPLGTGPNVEAGLSADGRSLAQLLKNNGYATALIGKWHLGYKPEFGPNAHGFDYFFGFKSGFIDYYVHVRGDGRPDLFENETPVQEPGYMTDLITDRSVRFITQHAGRPFFLEVAYNAAHWPFQRPDHHSVAANNGAFQAPGDDRPATRADYVAILERADEGVGRIVKTLDANGLTKNTLVIFTNDNGGEWLSRNAPLFHRKDTLWEGGIRVPAILKWPGRLPAGKTSGQVGITMDLTASILAATHTQVPPDAHPEGIDLIPILSGQARGVDRTLFWRISTPFRQQRAVRQGDLKMLIDGDDFLLYDLRKDVGERHDLALAKPDVVAALRRRIAEWEKEVDAEARSRKLLRP